MKKTGIAWIDEQQEREEIAARERKAVIATTPEVLQAFAMGLDRGRPAPEPIRDRSRDD